MRSEKRRISLSRSRLIILSFGILIIIALVFFYFVLIQGSFDSAILKTVNKRAPFNLKWKERNFLDFYGLEIRTIDNKYFSAQELRINVKPRLNLRRPYLKAQPNGRIGALVYLKFQDGYASQAREISCRNISAGIPLVFIWPDKFYPCGEGYIQCDELKINKISFLNPSIFLVADSSTILIKDFDGEILGSPVEAAGKIDIVKKCFTISSQFDRIDLEEVEALVNHKKFGGRGKWSGTLAMQYQEEEGFKGEGKFKLLSPGGELKTIFLKDLIQKMPEGEARKKLIQCLGEDEYFSLSQGEMDFYMEGEDVKIKLFLKGEKGLFDLTINLPVSLAERFFKAV